MSLLMPIPHRSDKSPEKIVTKFPICCVNNTEAINRGEL